MKGPCSPKSLIQAAKEDHLNQWGLEVPRQLKWRKWQPGGEYTKVVSLKNVSTKVLQVSYRLTQTKVFSMDFPESFKLSPGMVYALKVVFRPLQAQEYSDGVQLFCDGNLIKVPICAQLPCTNIQVPGSCDFGSVPAREASHNSLPIENIGDTPVSFSWKVQQPFFIEPASGRLNPGESLTCKVTFAPQDAAGYTISAACTLSNGEILLVKMAGTGKFPYLSLEAASMDFGEVLLGKSSEASVRFGNHSQVPAHFTVVQETRGHLPGEPEVFSITPMRGTLGPNEYSVLSIKYTPSNSGTFSCEHFALYTPGGNKPVLSLSGTAVGPVLKMSSRVLNFGNVPAGQTPSKVLYLQNTSNVPLVYHFQLEEGSVFSMSRPRGLIPPQLASHTTVHFKGGRPANYWCRVVCMVKDADPQGIDLLATAYDDKSRPPPLSHQHVLRYLARVAAGGPAIPKELCPASAGKLRSPASDPELLEAPPTGDDAGPLDTHSKHTPSSKAGPKGNTADVAFYTNTASSSQQDGSYGEQLPGPDSWGLLFGSQDPARVLQLNCRQLDFGSCSRLTAVGQQSFSVTNTSAAKLLVFVAVPSWQDPAGNGGFAGVQQVFQVFPDCTELPPYGSCTFHVGFRPPRDGVYYCQSLLVCAHIKAMRNFRLVEDDQVTPPWNVPLLACGHTFAGINPEFSPKMSLTASRITFPACNPGEAAAQTLGLRNYGDTPVHFSLSVVGLSAGARVQAEPQQGVVPPQTMQMVGLQFQPQTAGSWRARLNVVYNHVVADSTTVQLLGSAYDPQLQLATTAGSGEAGHKLYFRPTCIGAQSHRELLVYNPTRVSLGWCWKLSKALQGAVEVLPQWGVLRGNERTTMSWTFSPTKQQTYDARAALLVLPPAEVSAVAEQLAAAAAAATPGDLASGIAAPRDTQPAGSGFAWPGLGNSEDAAAGGAAGLAGPKTAQNVMPDISSGLDDVPKVVMQVIGLATTSALSCEPAVLELGTVRVGYPEHRTLKLLNQSGGVLRYSLEVVNEDPQGLEAAATAVLFVPALEGQQAGCDAWVNEPEGVVGARAFKTLNLTFLPGRRGRYTLRLDIRGSSLQQLRPTGRALSASAAGDLPHNGCLRPASEGGMASPRVTRGEPGAAGVGGGARVGSPIVRRVTDTSVRCSSSPAAGGSSSTRDISSSSGSRDSTLLCSARLTAQAHWPCVLVTGVKCEAIPPQICWQMLAVETLNQELRSPITDTELQLRTLDDAGSLTTEKAVGMTQAYHLDLGALGLGARPRHMWVTLSNDGPLPVTWELHSFDDPEVELENWVEPGKPLTAAEKARAFVVEAGILKAHPRSGHLPVGKSTQVCFTLNPVALGTYELPLFFHVQDGKQLQMLLHGQVTESQQQVALTTPGGHVMHLAACPLGEMEAPLQSFCIRNGGQVPLDYRLDITPLLQLTKDNYGFEVLQYCAGAPLQGSVPPGSVATLLWQFRPLEARHYQVTLPLMIGQQQPQQLHITGWGYHPHHPGAKEEAQRRDANRSWQNWLGFTPCPKLSLSHEAVLLSHHALHLGSMPLRSLVRQAVTLTNIARIPMAFSWDAGEWEEGKGLVAGRLGFLPATGLLVAGARVTCQISFSAGVQPQILQGEVHCHVRVADRAWENDMSGLQQQQQQQPASQGSAAGEQQHSDATENEEEVLALHPLRSSVQPLHTSPRLRNRLPLHVSMTESTCNKFELLKTRYQETLSKTMQQQYELTGHGSEDGVLIGSVGRIRPFDTLSASQRLTVMITGCILNEAQIAEGSYMPVGEQARALQLLQVTRVLPALDTPVHIELLQSDRGASAGPGIKTEAATSRKQQGQAAMQPPAVVAESAAFTSSRDTAGVSEDEPAATMNNLEGTERSSQERIGADDTAGVSGRGIAAAVGQEVAAIAAAGGVLQSIVQEVWADTDVAAAFSDLRPAPVLTFEKLKRQHRYEQQRLSSKERQGTDQRPITAAAAAAGRTDEPLGPGPAAAGSSPVGRPVDAGGQGQVEMQQQYQARLALQQPDVLGFVDYVIDNALLGLVQEGL